MTIAAADKNLQTYGGLTDGRIAFFYQGGFAQDSALSFVEASDKLVLAPTPDAVAAAADAVHSAFKVSAFTLTDSATTTVTALHGMGTYLGVPTIAQSGGAVTVTTASTLYVEPPTAGSSVTITNNYAAYFNGQVYLGSINFAGTAITASGAEINRHCTLSTRIVSVAVSTAITVALHDAKTIVLSGAGSARTMTLPAATGSGARFRFVVGEVNTSGYLFKSVVGTDIFEGIIFGASTTDSATDAARTWLSGATDDTITLNGTTTGGVAIGDWLEFEDISATGWSVRGMITQSGSEATPFSDTVT